MRRVWLILALMAILVTPGLASAGVLTSGAYTYLLKGETVELPVDLLTLRGRHLVPTELLALFGVRPAVTDKSIRLARGSALVELTLGEATALVNGQPVQLGVAPLKTGERLFIPAELLPELAINLEVDGKFALLEDYRSNPPAPEAPTDAPFTQRWAEQTLTNYLRVGSEMGEVSVTLLTPDLLSDPAFELSWGTRQRLLHLAQNRTLMYVSLKNPSLRAMSLDPRKLMLVDPDGRQYDYLGLELPLDGIVSAPVAPGASRSAILAFPKVDAERVTLYYDGSGTVLGRVPAK